MRLFSVAGPGPYDLPKKAPRNKSIKSPCKKFPRHFIRYSSIETFKHEYNCINCIYIEHASMSVLVAPPQSVFSATNPTKAQVHGRGPTNPCLPSHGGGKKQYIYGRGKQKILRRHYHFQNSTINIRIIRVSDIRTIRIR